MNTDMALPKPIQDTTHREGGNAAGQTVYSVLKRFWGYDSLRPLQAEAIDCALNGRDSLTVLPTGGGKSLCYQIPPMIHGSLDLVVSPLIALMKDQVDGLRQSGYPAAALHSGLSADERQTVEQAMIAGKIRLCFVSPERLVTPEFLDFIRPFPLRRFAIDEAHCISQWGHDFRPEYRQLSLLRKSFPRASLHAYTATATPRVREDIVRQLQLRDPSVWVGVFDRPNLIYRVLPKTDVEEQTAAALSRHPGEAAIVYCLSRKDTETLAAHLESRGFRAAFYHAGMESEDRRRVQDAFSSETLDVVVATVAFGMGIDRSNVRCVVHATLPKSLEHYQQETGRAGRDGLEAECVLFYSSSDVMRWKNILDKAQEREDPDSSRPRPSPEERLAIRQAQDELLRGMQRYSQSARCRHRALSEYFGQAYEPDDCQACDVCRNEVEAVEDGTILAQKILSCVARTEQHFGVGHVVDVLLGSNTENVRRFHHDQLSTYGIVQNQTRPSLMAAVYQLVDEEVLVRTEGDRPVLKLNDKSWEVLRGQRSVRVIRAKAGIRKQTRRGEVAMQGVDPTLFDALKAWRQKQAQSMRVPAYVIFHDTTLIELARRRPKAPHALGGIPGMSDKKCSLWGSAIIAVIQTHTHN